MDSNLYNSMKNKTDENLFFYFKHDGSYNFQKKIVAGIILHERKYNKAKLISEKEKILINLKKNTNHFFDNGTLKQKHKAKIRKELKFMAIAAYCLMSANLIYRIIRDGFNTAHGYMYAFYCIILLAFILHKVISFNKSLSKKVKAKENSFKQHNIRLETINREWKF